MKEVRLENYFSGTRIEFEGVVATVHFVVPEGLGIMVLESSNDTYTEGGEYFVPYSAGVIFKVCHEQREKFNTVFK